MKKLIMSAALMALASVPANALTFNLTDIGGAGVGTQARVGYEVAAAYWSSVLTDNVAVNVNIGFSSLAGSKLSQTSWTKQDVSIKATVAALDADKTSPIVDQDVIDYMVGADPIKSGAFKGLTAIGPMVNATRNTNTNYSNSTYRTDTDKSKNNVYLAANTSVVKALGLATSATSDGGVTLNSNASFDFNPSDGVTTGANDFVAVAIREIGHVLGFVSGVDTYDAVTEDGKFNSGSKAGVLDGVAVGSVLDLFRYHGIGQLDWTTFYIDDAAWRPYFSVTGGYKAPYDPTGNPIFGDGVKNGDGTAASNWAVSRTGCAGITGIMSSDLCKGQSALVKWSDLSAFDATGWNLAAGVMDKPGYSFSTAQAYRTYIAANSPAPEPATWAMMLGGFGLIGAAMRRKRAILFAA